MSSQIIINILYSFSLYVIVSLSFNIIYITCNFFHISHAGSITLSAYFYYLLINSPHFSFLQSSLISATIVCLINGAIAYYIYLPLRKKESNPFVFLIASLGIYVVIQNLISLFFGDDVKSVRTGLVEVGHEIVGAHITNIQIVSIFCSLLLYVITIIIFEKTKLGRQIKAVSSNEVASNIYGINTENTILYSILIGSAYASISGILMACDESITTTMGFNLLLYGIIAMIIGGIGSLSGLVRGSLLLAISQHISAYYIDTKWINPISYFVLVIFLVWKPLGFSGKRLKKVEI